VNGSNECKERVTELFIASGAREMALVSNYSLLRLCKNGARLCFGAK